MSFDWDQYYVLAKDLAGRPATPNEEARKRSAISRAYYAAIIQGREKISARSGDSYPYKNTHHWTIKKFKQDPAPDAKRIGSHLKRLKKRRERADYDHKVQNLDSELKSALSEAKSLLKRIKQLPTSP
jgi:uncharacterized protein (UPF0332 family)